MEENKLPKRKPTRMSSFDYSRGGAYFITICTQDRKSILSRIVQAKSTNSVGDGAHDIPKIQLTQVGKIVEKYVLSTSNIKGVSVVEYVIMPNHIHLILRVDNDGTSIGVLKNPCDFWGSRGGAVPYKTEFDCKPHRFHAKTIC